MKKASRKELAETGRPFTGHVFRVGQTIEFPPIAELDPHIEPLGASMVPFINAIIDDKPQWVPYGSFIKTPHGKHAEEFLQKFEVNRQIVEIPDNDQRTDFFAGKKLRVKEIFVGQKPVYKKAAGGGYEFGRNEDNSIATQPGDFPVFEWVTA